MKKTFFLLLFAGFNSAALFAQDDVHYQRDSVIETEDDCIQGFFTRNEPVSDPAKLTVTAKNGRTYTLSSFMKVNRIGGFSSSAVADLDGDGKKELILSNFTGGAHCCDEIYLFRNTGGSKYQYVAKMYGGHTCISPENGFRFSFYEHFGYFFTCYACAYPDTSDAAPIPVSSVELKFTGGKLKVVPGNPELKSMIRDNLSKLSEQPYEKLEDIAQDNGLRKEFALNLAVYHYSFGRNLVETRALFNQYYKFPDAKKVWTEFQRLLLNVKKTNDW